MKKKPLLVEGARGGIRGFRPAPLELLSAASLVSVSVRLATVTQPSACK